MVVYSLAKDCYICKKPILPGEKFSTKGDEIFHDGCFDRILMSFEKDTYTDRYNLNYFTEHPEYETQPFWEDGMLRYGDQCAALGYALGYRTFDEVRERLRFNGIGKELYPKIKAKEQVLRLLDFQERKPIGILEIGGGRGEVSLALCCFLDLDVQLIEPSKDLGKLIELTSNKLGLNENGEGMIEIINLPLGKALSKINWKMIDTILFIESIEHIMEEEFEKFYSVMKERFHGLFIITNWIDYHPITLKPPWHVRRIDDSFYNRLCSEGKRIFRRGSHLVVEY